MREQDPIDELFARGLREAEVAPPPQVWPAIVRERDGVHSVLLKLKRHWGLVALLLLLGSTTAYWGLTSKAPVNATNTISGNKNVNSVLMAEHSPIADERSIAPTNDGHTAPPTDALVTTVAMETRSSDDATAPELLTGPAASSQEIVHSSEEPTSSAPSPKIQGTALSTGMASQPAPQQRSGPEDQDLASLTTGVGGIVAAVTPRPDPYQDVAASDRSRDPVTNSSSETPSLIESTDLADARAWPLPLREPVIEGPELARASSSDQEPKNIGPRRGWWVAATFGAFHENRSWRGGDAQLRNALSNTEVPHTVWGVGVAGGVEWRGGWGLSLGIEHSSARYDFRHVDRYRTTTDSLVPYVITFNGEVIDSHTDTLTTFSDEASLVTAVNSYRVLRVPLEGSWHRAWRRWHVGVRAGFALEFGTLRTGSTLVPTPGGARSVDVASLPDERHTSLMTGSLAADLGYALTDRVAIWASPTYVTNLLPLSGHNGSPYAEPERLGVSFRLAYTLQTRR